MQIGDAGGGGGTLRWPYRVSVWIATTGSSPLLPSPSEAALDDKPRTIPLWLEVRSPRHAMASPVESTHSAPEAPGADESSSSTARSAMVEWVWGRAAGWAEPRPAG